MDDKKKKGRTGEQKAKLYNFRMYQELMDQVDAYWELTNRFANRSEFLTFLINQELVERRLLGEKKPLESSKVMQKIAEFEEKLSTMEKEKWNLINGFLTVIKSLEDKYHSISTDATASKEFGTEVFRSLKGVFSDFLEGNMEK